MARGRKKPEAERIEWKQSADDRESFNFFSIKEGRVEIEEAK